MLGGGGRVSPLWLVLVYLLQTFGELCPQSRRLEHCY